MPNFYWCQRPGCGSGQIHSAPPSNNPVFTCSSCGYKHCLNHPTIPYHTGLTCSQYESRISSPSQADRVLAEKAGLKKVQEIGKRCPNAMCGWWIEKNEGCDHMTCWKCGFEFCWECGASMRVVGRKGVKGHRRGGRDWGGGS